MNKFDYQNFIMFTGDSANIYVTVYDCDGEVVPLTDCSIDWICDIDDNTVISKATDDGSITVDLVKQEFVVHLTPEDTENLSATSYPHKAIIVDYEGNRSTILKGFVSFK